MALPFPLPASMGTFLGISLTWRSLHPSIQPCFLSPNSTPHSKELLKNTCIFLIYVYECVACMCTCLVARTGRGRWTLAPIPGTSGNILHWKSSCLEYKAQGSVPSTENKHTKSLAVLLPPTEYWHCKHAPLCMAQMNSSQLLLKGQDRGLGSQGSRHSTGGS